MVCGSVFWPTLYIIGRDSAVSDNLNWVRAFAVIVSYCKSFQIRFLVQLCTVYVIAENINNWRSASHDSSLSLTTVVWLTPEPIFNSKRVMNSIDYSNACVFAANFLSKYGFLGMRSQQNCSKQEERRYWTECTEYVWRSGKLVSGQRNGRSPRSSHFPRKTILNSVQITEQLLLSPTQARSFFGSYWRGSE